MFIKMSCPYPLLSWRGWCITTPSKFPFHNISIPRRANKRSMEGVPTTISHRWFMVLQCCNLSSTHLWWWIIEVTIKREPTWTFCCVFFFLFFSNKQTARSNRKIYWLGWSMFMHDGLRGYPSRSTILPLQFFSQQLHRGILCRVSKGVHLSVISVSF